MWLILALVAVKWALLVLGYRALIAALYCPSLADRPAGGEATTRAPSIGTEPYRGKG